MREIHLTRENIKEKRRRKIEHILNVAAEVFAEKGYTGVSTNEIADLAGVSKRSMYYYVGDKDTLYLSVIKRLMAGGLKHFNELKAENDLDPELRLKLFINALAQAGADRNVRSVVLRELLSGGGVLPDYYFPESLGMIRNILSDIIEKGKEQCGFNEINPLIATVMMLSFFFYWQLTTPHLSENENTNKDISPYGTGISTSLIDEIEKMLLCVLKCKCDAQPTTNT
jgi:AcrR family transcriptional regulator